MTDLELYDKLLSVYGFNDGPESQEDLKNNESAIDEAAHTMRVARLLWALNPHARALIINHIT